MTGRERMLAALRFEEPDRPPHFEIMFDLTEEAFGLSFPDWSAWSKATTAGAKDRLVGQCMRCYEKIVERYAWDALAVYYPWCDPDGVVAAKKTFGTDILIGSIVGNSIWSIECIKDWMAFSLRLVDEPESIIAEADAKHAAAITAIDRLIDAGADFIHIVNDIGFNGGTFISPDDIRRFCFPYLRRQVAHVKARGAIPFIHTDGDIRNVLDDWIDLGAACYQSVDPMAGMDIAEVKRRSRGRMALMGNVQCSLLQDGPKEAIRASAEYCLTHATPGGGFIYGSSNTIFKGLPLENYEYMVSVYRDFCTKRKG